MAQVPTAQQEEDGNSSTRPSDQAKTFFLIIMLSVTDDVTG